MQPGTIHVDHIIVEIRHGSHIVHPCGRVALLEGERYRPADLTISTVRGDHEIIVSQPSRRDPVSIGHRGSGVRPESESPLVQDWTGFDESWGDFSNKVAAGTNRTGLISSIGSVPRAGDVIRAGCGHPYDILHSLFLLRFLDGGQSVGDEYRCQDTDDGNHDQQLNQGESLMVLFHLRPPLKADTWLDYTQINLKKKGDASYASPFFRDKYGYSAEPNSNQDYEPTAAVLGARIQEPFHMTRSLLK